MAIGQDDPEVPLSRNGNAKFGLHALILIAPFLLIAFMDIPRNFQFGPMTGLGVITIALVFLPLMGVATGRLPSALAWTAAPLALFVTWSFASTSGEIIFLSVQQSLVPATFLGYVLLGGLTTYRQPEAIMSISAAITLASLMAGLIYATSLIIGGLGSNWLFSARAFSLSVAVALSWFLAASRYGSSAATYISFALLVLVVLSLSRLAILIVLVLAVASRFSPNLRGLFRTIVFLSAASLLGAALLTYFEPVRSRFLEGDVQAVGGISLNVMGRFTLWDAVWSSFWQSPWLGGGTGSSSALVGELFSQEHVHNDYLRILHDQGLLGIALWMLSLLTFFAVVWRNWGKAERSGSSDAKVHLSALLALTTMTIGMITDNFLVYVTAMAPTGAMVGMSVGLGCRARAAKLAHFLDERNVSIR